MPSSPVTPPDAPISPIGKETFATITHALCTPLKGHQPDPMLIRSAEDIASVRESLIEAMPEAHRTPDRVKLVERASAQLLFGLANFSLRALNRARASLEEALTWPDAPELHRQFGYGARIANNVIRHQDDSRVRQALREVFVEGLDGMLAGRPLRIDVDLLERLTLSSDADDHARIAAHTALLPAFRQLADTGLCPAPVFFSDLPRAVAAGWLPVRDSQGFETQGFETQSDILQSVLRPSPSDATPLPRLSILHPDVHQALDRQRGVLRIQFPKAHKQEATITTVKLPPLATSVGAAPPEAGEARHARHARHAQDALLDLLDRFCVDTPGGASSPWSLRPPEIGVDREDRKIRFGELPVATLTQDAWSVDADAMSHAREVLEQSLVRRQRPVQEWAGPRVPLARRESPSSPERLRLVVQVEDDQILNDNAASRQLAHPGETVWIQADAQGRQRILAGESLLAGVRADARIKVEVHGHGGRAGLTDERILGGRSATEVGILLAETMDHCKLPHRIDEVDLTSCALATPVFPRQFAEEVLRSGHDLDLFHSATTITAYADSLTFTLEPDSLQKLAARRTLFAESSAGDIRAPGKTWILSLNRETGRVLRRDKHPGLKGVPALSHGKDPLPPRGAVGAVGSVEPVEQTSAVTWSGASPWSGLGLLPR